MIDNLKAVFSSLTGIGTSMPTVGVSGRENGFNLQTKRLMILRIY
jgi:hypothetical protein